MADLNANVQVTVTTDAPPVSQAGFGVPLFAADAVSLGGGFVERVRYYSTNDEAQADADLSEAAKNALQSMFSQNPHVDSAAVGRVEADEAQVDTVTFTGTTAVAAEVFTITINGTDYTFPAVGGETPAALATALAPLVDADPDVSAVDSGGGVVTITADVAGDSFTTAVSTDSVGIAMAQATTNENVNIGSELDAIVAESADWYGLCIESRDATHIERAAAWTESAGRFFVAQSSDSDILTAATTDIVSTLAGLSYTRTLVCYHATDTQYEDAALLGLKLAANPDEITTFWKYATLAGISVDDLTATQRDNVIAKGGNVYLTFFGQAAIANGYMVNGNPADLLITLDWVTARIREAIAQRFLSASNANDKIPYTDAGIQIFSAIVRKVLAVGEAIGHFTPDTSEVTAPLASAVTSADKANRILRLSFVTEAAGAIESVRVNGSVVVDLN